MPRHSCEITDRTFGESDARADLRNHQKRGAPSQTQEMLRQIRSLGIARATLLDIGGGVGVIHHELLKDVAASAVHVDASSAYLGVARQEAARLGQGERVRFIHADFTDVAGELPAADIVTLDRVVCCYPDFRRLLGQAATRCSRVMGLTYPREAWFVRLTIRAINLVQRIRQDPLRVFLHQPQELDRVLREAGLRRLSVRRFAVWEAAVYVR